jgi:hypothetical protein
MKRKKHSPPKVIPVFESHEENPLPMKPLPSLEEVYKRLYLIEQEAIAKGQKYSVKRLKANTMMSQIRIALIDEANKHQDNREEWCRQLRHMCELYFWKENSNKS